MESRGQPINGRTHKAKDRHQETDYYYLPIDHGWAYATVFGCFGVCALVVGTLKSFGVILVELFRQFNVPASILTGPQSLAGFFHLSMGPLANVLSEKYSHRLVVFIGGVLAMIGLISTSFVQSVVALYFTYGVLTGVGLGFCFSPSITFQGFHFQKRRALANGLSASGSGAGAFALPPLIRFLINHYGLSGCLLILGGLVLNSSMFSCLFRPPSFWKLYNRSKDFRTGSKYDTYVDFNDGKETDDYTNKNNTLLDKDDSDFLVRSSTNSDKSKLTTYSILEKPNDENKAKSRTRRGTYPEIIEGGIMDQRKVKANEAESHRINNITFDRMNDGDQPTSVESLPCIANIFPNQTHGPTSSRSESSLVYSKEHRKIPQSPMLTRSLVFASLESLPTGSGLLHSNSETTDEGGKVTVTKKKFKLDWSLLKNPTYMLFISAMFTGVMGQHSLFNIFPSVASELGHSDQQGSVLVSVLGASDLVGRIVGGWFADLGYFKRQTIYVLNLFVFAILGFAVAQMSSFLSFCVMAALLGLFSGGYSGVQIAVLADKVGVEKLSSAWGFSAFLASIALLVNPFLAGMIRDVTGSWKGAIRVGAGFAAAGSISLVIEAIIGSSIFVRNNIL